MPLDLRTTVRPVTRVAGGHAERVDDAIAVERALEIRVAGRPLVVTLRTPGNDLELALGFLASEGVVRHRADIAKCEERLAACADEPDIMDLELGKGVGLDWTRFERHVVASAACGLCGRAHIESLRAGLVPLQKPARIDYTAIGGLQTRMRNAQVAFAATGGLHAAALLDDALDEVRVLREDVGRHNAVDKVCGWLVESGDYPANRGVLWVSGRAGAEIVLKAARGRIPMIAAVGAPSSLAIELAEAARLTLVGFVREGRMNVYTGGRS